MDSYEHRSKQYKLKSLSDWEEATHTPLSAFPI